MTAHSRWLTCSLFLIGVATVAIACLVQTGSEVTQQEAVRASAQFLHTVGLKPTKTPPSVRRSSIPAGWEVGVGEYRVTIDGATGKPVSFHNDKREWEIINRMGRTGRRRFRNQAEAMAYVRSLAAKLGVPRNWKLKNPARAGIPDARGEVSAAFEERPYAYRYLGLAGGNVAYITLDAQDGVIKGWAQYSAFVADAPHLRITRQQAVAAATKAYRAYFAGRRAFHGGPVNAAGIQLGYAVRLDRDRKPLHARLVWEVPFGQQPVRVDAETGAVTDIAELELK